MTQDYRRPQPWETTPDRFRLLVDSVKDYSIFMLDPDGYVITWNSGAQRVNGYTADEIIGSHFSRFYPPDDLRAGKPKRELARALELGYVEDEGWRLRKDGTRFWADVVITAIRDPVTNEHIGFGKVTRDLTERRLAEERLRQSEEQFRLLIESVEEYAIFMLDVTGHVATWNSGAERAKGYKAEEIIGEHFERFYTPPERAAGRPAKLLEIARTKGFVRDQGLRCRKDGTTFVADVLITAIHDATGELRGFSKVTRDITDQIRARENEAAKLAAERASQQKDEFLAVLSHELRTPLTPVVAGLSYLLENLEGVSQTELRETLGTLRRNVLLEARLIDDLLDLTRISRGKIELRFEAVDLHVAIHEVVGICQEDVDLKGIHLAFELSAAEHWAWGDPTRLRQIFWNLINNAVKFTPGGGQITLRTENEPAGHFHFSVQDSGIGLDPEQAPRIFRAFEQGERTVTRQFGGLGLGLAISRSMVELHGGTIAAHSEGRGRGSTFTVTLGLLPPELMPTDGAATETVAPARSIRILLVDDHDDTRRILARLLVRNGHRVESASSVKDAMEQIAAQPFDVLVSDIGLPDGSGLELMQKALAQQPHLKGIALSGFGMEEDTLRSLEAGFSHHLTKPVEVPVLEERLASLFP